MKSSPPVLSLADVAFSYGKREVLQRVSLRLEHGQSAAIMGRTGSGKSTLLACICGLVRPAAGKVEVLGRSIPDMSRRALAAYRRQHLGVVFQFGELLPSLTAVENVALPAILSGVGWPAAEAQATDLLASLGVSPTEQPSMSLSGGERTRVAIARALINKPELLIADEPTGALDTETRDAVRDLIYQIPRIENCGLLVVTHDPAMAARADAAYRLQEGRLESISNVVAE